MKLLYTQYLVLKDTEILLKVKALIFLQISIIFSNSFDQNWASLSDKMRLKSCPIAVFNWVYAHLKTKKSNPVRLLSLEFD